MCGVALSTDKSETHAAVCFVLPLFFFCFMELTFDFEAVSGCSWLFC